MSHSIVVAPHSSVGINSYHLARDVFQPGGLYVLQEMPAQAKIYQKERENVMHTLLSLPPVLSVLSLSHTLS